MICRTNKLDIVSVFDAIRLLGHEIDFEPLKPCQPTGAKKGTIERLEVYRLRVENGEVLYHPNDEPTATTDEWAACIAFCRASIKATKAAKRLAAIEKEKTINRSRRQTMKNASAKRARQIAREREKEQRRATGSLRMSPFAKHPDVLES